MGRFQKKSAPIKKIRSAYGTTIWGGLRPQTPNILLTGKPRTTNIHIENLQINLNMGNTTNINGVTIKERIKALRDALKPKNW
jgi:hypothetical protein